MRSSNESGRNYLRVITIAIAMIGTMTVATACVSGPSAVPISGVVDHVDAAANLVVLDTSFGPLTATLGLSSTITRQALPGDAPDAKLGRIGLATVQRGSNASVMVSASRLQQIIADASKPTTAANAAANAQTLLKRSYGLLDGYTVAASQMQIGPAPASIEASDRDKLALHAIPATFVAANPDGTLTALVSKYGYVKVIVGPGTRYDALGRTINPTSLKHGDSLILYGSPVWVGRPQTAGDGSSQSTLPVTLQIASLHLVTTNEQILTGRVVTVTAATISFRITGDDGDSYTITVIPATTFQSLVVGQPVNDLGQLKPGSHIVAYTIGDNDTAANVYLAWTVYLSP